MSVTEALRVGDLASALGLAQAKVRSQSADAKARASLVEVLLVQGQWDRAHTQLGVLESLDAAYLPFSRACQVAMQCEQLRAAVFGGERAPLVLGEPQTWLAQLIESNRLLAHGETEASADLRAQAFEGASTSSGALNGTPFSWLADQDSRLGPTLELYLDAKYYWVPISHISRLKCLAPQTTRDLIWSTVEVTWSTGGESVALMPVRYPGTEVAHDDALRLSRRTEWRTAGGDFYCGTGQRVLGIDDADVGVLDVREIVIEPAG